MNAEAGLEAGLEEMDEDDDDDGILGPTEPPPPAEPAVEDGEYWWVPCALALRKLLST